MRLINIPVRFYCRPSDLSLAAPAPQARNRGTCWLYLRRLRSICGTSVVWLKEHSFLPMTGELPTLSYAIPRRYGIAGNKAISFCLLITNFNAILKFDRFLPLYSSLRVLCEPYACAVSGFTKKTRRTLKVNTVLTVNNDLRTSFKVFF